MNNINEKTAEYFDECMDNLCHTRDIDIYLDALFALRDKYLIILSVKDTPGHKMSETTFEKVRSVGFTQLTRGSWRTYIGVINHGTVIFNKSGKKAGDPLEYSAKLGELDISVTSKAYLQGNISEIKINGEDYSLNSRGWNIVVIDTESNTIVDSMTYDAHTVKTTLYHKDLDLDVSYFKSNFYIREKYINGWIERYSKKYFSNRKLGCKEIDKGIIEPIKEINGRSCGGLCDEKFNFVAGHEKKIGAGPYNECSECYTVDENDQDYIDETVIYGGVMINHPGHLIVDSLAERIWWVLEHPEIDFRIAVVTWVWGSESAKFIKEFMDVLNIPVNRLIIVKKTTKFKKVIVPDQAHVLLSLDIPYDYTKEFVLLFDRIRDNVKPAEYKKIYITKSQTSKQNIVGENYFIEFYKNKGFKIVDPENYTIREKAELFNGADEVVSTMGTNTLFMIFCKPTVKLTILTRVGFESNPGQVMVNQAAGITNMTIVNVATDFLHKNFVRGLNLLCVTEEFRSYVKETYNEEIDITPEESLKNVLFEYLKYFPEYYASPRPFDTLKNQKMLTILQNMSEIFLGKEFDSSKLNLTTNEDNLRERVKQLTEDLSASKMRVTELENTDICNAAKCLETTSGRLEKQIAEMQNTLHSMRNLQAEINELTVKNTNLEESLLQANHLLEAQANDIEQLQEKNKNLSSQLQQSQETNSELQKQIALLRNKEQ